MKSRLLGAVVLDEDGNEIDQGDFMSAPGEHTGQGQRNGGAPFASVATRDESQFVPLPGGSQQFIRSNFETVGRRFDEQITNLRPFDMRHFENRP
jgi:hypothetical protein